MLFSKLSPFLAAGTTVLLAGLFWAPIGAERPRPIARASLAGRTLAFNRTPVAAPAPEAPPAAPKALIEPPPKPTARRAVSRKIKTKEPVKAPAPARQEPAATAPSAAAAAPVAVSTPAAEAPPRASLQDLLDRFESDPSRYPLDRSVRKDGITLTLEGLARLDQYYVLKVTVINETGADFFVKDFAVQAGTMLLSSRTVFRILVEPQRERGGYVVFEKPKPGTAVHVALKEDGGKGRVVETAVPYHF